MGKQILNGVEYITATTKGFPPLIYSNAEREVGVWTDGKPLYCKTIHISSFPNATTSNYPHNISNIDKIVLFLGGARSSNGNFFLMSHVNTVATGNQIAVNVNKTNISIATGTIDRSGLAGDITIYYTKTTDTAGSGKYSAIGDLMHHYSETEQVVGTWIDGKPIYEKTIVKNNIAVTPPDGYIAHEIQNVNMIIRLNVLTFNSNSPTSYTSESGGLSFTGGSSTTIMNGFRADRTNIMFIGTAGSGTWSADVNRYWYFTLQYTKTTD